MEGIAGELARVCGPGTLEAHFQPIIDFTTRVPMGAEGLARWRRPDGALMQPAEFIPAIETAGANRSLTRAMLGLALDAVKDWRENGHPCYVAVNITGDDLLDPRFVGEVAEELLARDIAPSALCVEISERFIVGDPAQAVATIGGLREGGIRIGLDDFGTGYSSLSHLIDLAVDAVKVDRRFVAAMTTSRQNRMIVEAVAALAKKLGLTVVAEGVEDEATWDALRDLGVDRAQGFLCARPTPAGAMLALLDSLAAAGADHRAGKGKPRGKRKSVR